MGAARRHLARLAAPEPRLARQDGPVPWVYAEIVRLLTRYESIHLLVNDSPIEKRAKKMLADAGADLAKVRFWMLPTDRVWVRDYGPIFVVNSRGEAGVLDWRFNAWAKYPDWENDDAIPSKILKEIDAPSWTPRAGGKRVVLEGGSIDVNGAGCVLTTEECLLSDVQARNPHLTREQVERVLRDFLGPTRSCGSRTASSATTPTAMSMTLPDSSAVRRSSPARSRTRPTRTTASSKKISTDWEA